MQKRQWVHIANSTLRTCLADGKSQKFCEGKAIRSANGAVGSNEMEIYISLHEHYSTRIEMLEGRRQVVVPVVMMVEGVHAGSHGPLFHSAEELGKYPIAWDGRPVTVPHPNDEDGNPASANTPENIEQFTVGRVFNTHMDGTRLRAEAWLDEQKLRQYANDTYEIIMAGQPLDVSIGVITDDEFTPGEWNGEAYDAVARNHRPDHLALLPGRIGACSWADGCGVRANMKGGEEENMKPFLINALSYAGTEKTAFPKKLTLKSFGVKGEWDKLDEADRLKVASHFLAGSSSLDSYEGLKYPVVNPKTGNLNERALQAVVEDGSEEFGDMPEEMRGIIDHKANALLADEFQSGFDEGDDVGIIKKLAGQGRYVSTPQVAENEAGYREKTRDIQSKLDVMDTDAKLHFLVEVYDDWFVYEVQYRDRPGSTFYKRTYSLTDNENIEFTGEPVEVRRQVEFITVNTSKGGMKTMAQKTTPCCKEKVEMIIQADHLPFTEDDREYLLTLNEARVDEILAVKEPKAPIAPAVNEDDVVKKVLQNLSDPEKALGFFPKDIRENLQYGMKEYNAKRQATIDSIVANSNGVYTAEDLKDRPFEELEKLNKAIPAPVMDYSLGGGAGRVAVNEGDILLPAGTVLNKTK